jgi:hypothetical protein
MDTTSGHRRVVHSRRKLGWFLGGSVFNRGCDLRGIIELRECVLPWSMFLYVPLDILRQVTAAFPFVVPCALVEGVPKVLICYP